MTEPQSVAHFIDRQRHERTAAGMSATITDIDTLRVVAALVAVTQSNTTVMPKRGAA